MPEPLRQRDPRQRDPERMAWVAKQICVPCMVQGRRHHGVQVCHVNMGVPGHEHEGWREFGGAEKAHDWRTVPMCPKWHMDSMAGGRPDAQHQVGERNFWRTLCIDPRLLIAAMSEDYAAGRPADATIMRFAMEARRLKGGFL